MIRYDTHMHTSYSTDSDTDVSEQVKRAEQLGLEGICITDHMDYDFPIEEINSTMEGIPFCFDIASYWDCLEHEQRNTDIKLLRGVECGLQETMSVIEKNEQLLSCKDWDYVIGSLHLLEGKDPYYPSFWEGRTPSHGIRDYFNSILENIKCFSDFDALGHMDYIVRYAPQSFHYEPNEYREIIDAILRLLIKKDIALEVNTSGWKKAGRCQNPHFDILCHYASLGGELLTIGSDAHTPEYVAYCFSDLPELLKKAGLRQYCVYQKRKPVFYDIV